MFSSFLEMQFFLPPEGGALQQSMIWAIIYQRILKAAHCGTFVFCPNLWAGQSFMGRLWAGQ